jgi:tRNA threonylcarbamoyladenosine dehydratase
MAIKNDYYSLFERNIGVLTKRQQEELRSTRVAIAGLGGVGGIIFERLVRLGIENFNVAEPDTFEASNLNRQMFSNFDNIGQKKAAIIIQEVKKINPNLSIKFFEDGVNDENVKEFVNADIIIDAVEYNLTYFLYLLHREARLAGKTVLAGQAIGFDSTLFVFSPKTVTFEDYIGLKSPDKMTVKEVNNYRIPLRKFCPKLPKYIPKALALKVVLREQYIPSCSLGVMSAATLLEMVLIKIVLRKGKIKFAPDYYNLDVYNI